MVNNKKICFVSCVNDYEMYNEMMLYINSLEIPQGYEIDNIYIEEAECITEAYNAAIENSDAKYKVYIHQDVFIINKNFISDILEFFQQNEEVGMIGVAGAKNIPQNCIWWESQNTFGKIYDSHTGDMQLYQFEDVKREYESVQCIDGLIMITQYDVPWRQDLFDGWHFYDISQSMEFIKKGYKVVIPKQDKPWCIHDSGIPNTDNGFEKYRKIFSGEYGEEIKDMVDSNLTNIIFLETRNSLDLEYNMSMAYKQIKPYLFKYSDYRNEISMNYCNEINNIPNDVDIIAISSTSQNFNEAIKMGIEIRSKYPDVLLLIGGHHISYFPKSLPKEYDIGILFEGEETFVEVVDSYLKNGKDIEKLANIDGTVFQDREKGERKLNPLRKLIAPLDDIPFPFFEDNDPYIFSSRGCPYDCSFCSSTEYWKKFRTFSADYVISEIEYIINNYPGITRITFWDDLVIADKQRFKQIVEKIEEKNINKQVGFVLAVRANLVDEEICKLLKRMNVDFVTFGAESASDRILQMLKGDSVTVEINQRALDFLSKYRIPVSCGFIIGNPTETKEDVQKTFDFILKNYLDGKLSDCALNILMPLPGTKMWEYGINNKIIQEPIDWTRLQVFASYKNSKVNNINDWVEMRLKSNSYYLNEEYIPQKELLEMLCQFEMNLEKITYLMDDSMKLNMILEKIKNSSFANDFMI